MTAIEQVNARIKDNQAKINAYRLQISQHNSTIRNYSPGGQGWIGSGCSNQFQSSQCTTKTAAANSSINKLNNDIAVLEQKINEDKMLLLELLEKPVDSGVAANNDGFFNDPLFQKQVTDQAELQKQIESGNGGTGGTGTGGTGTSALGEDGILKKVITNPIVMAGMGLTVLVVL